MKTTKIYFGSILLMIGMAACNGSGTTSGSDTLNNGMHPGDSSVTTTTTTTVTHHKYSGSFIPQPNVKYIDLKTRKEVQVRIDTVQGSVVNSETNLPIDLFVVPTTHDTIYGKTGTVVNNYIIHDDSGDYKVDESKLPTISEDIPTPAPEPSTVETATPSSSINGGDGKYKEKENKAKYKDADEKVKERNGIIKTKDR